MDIRENALDVSGGEAPHDAPHDLHVLLRHRLRRQTHGFESLVLIEENVNVHDSSVP
jgi:hypothetical protein